MTRDDYPIPPEQAIFANGVELKQASQLANKATCSQLANQSMWSIMFVFSYWLKKLPFQLDFFYEHLSSTSLDHPYVLHNGNYAMLFSPFRQTHWTPVICNSECTIVTLQSISEYPPKWLQPCLVVTWLVPCETAPISLHVLWTPYNCAPIYRVTLFKATYVGRWGV